MPEVEAAAARAPAAVGRRVAHDFLSTWRLDEPAAVWTDLTDRSEFDWVAYLAGHPDRRLVFDEGKRQIVKFAITRLTTVFDNNLKDKRVDFVAVGSDDMMIRLHPGSKVEAKPVLCMEDATQNTQLSRGTHSAAAPRVPRGQGQGAGVRDARRQTGKGIGKGPGKARADQPFATPQGKGERRAHFLYTAQQDLVSTSVVRTWVQSRLAANVSPFVLNMTDGVDEEHFPQPIIFLWHRWFAAERLLSHIAPFVTDIWVVKLKPTRGEDQAGIFVKTESREYLAVFVGKSLEVLDEPNVADLVDWQA